MQKTINKASFALAAVLCVFVLFMGGGVSAAEAVDDTESYYAPITAEGGTSLLGQIHDLITTTHDYYSSYADCRDYAPQTDPPVGGSVGEESIVEFYTHETIVTYVSNSNHVGRWNREHVWCKSLSNGMWKSVKNTDRGGGADLHHIRPSEMSLNSARGDGKYGAVRNGSPVYSQTEEGTRSLQGGTVANNVFEPVDGVKGDVARIVMYVYAHYNTYENVGGTTDGSGMDYYFGTLRFTDVVSASSDKEAVALLLSWNELDPVDEIERTRNDAVYQIQGNRNPFIDHPEYAEAVWGVDAPDADFGAAVAAIVKSGDLSVRLASIERALGIYRTLTARERELSAEDVALLQAAISAYNEAVAERNAFAAAADGTALSGIGGVFTGGAA